MKAVYFGTPNFAAEILSYLLNHGIEIVAVVTKPDKPQGRSHALVPTPVKCIAEKHSLPLFQPDIVSAIEYAPILEKFEADLFLVVAYGEILKQHLLDMPKIACINVHASLLPKYRGAAPIQRCIMSGEKETGITIMHMVKKMDAGDIITIEKVAIGTHTTYGELENELCQIGAKLLFKTIKNFEVGEVTRTIQDHSLATFAKKIELEDCQIDWKQPAESIHNLVRAVNPHPIAWCNVTVKDQHKRLKVISTSIASEDPQDIAGKIIPSKKELLVNCGKGVLKLIKIQLEGKKMMLAEEFLRGFSTSSLQFHVN